jgi:hypothetical protein
MRISHKHKFISISIPKTGSTSVRHALDKFSDQKSVSNGHDTFYHHSTYSRLRERLDYIDDYFVFAFVRNPWDRVVSQWHYMNNYAQSGSEINYKKHCNKVLKSIDSFSQFAKSKHTIGQCMNWVQHQNSVAVNYVGKMETIQYDFDIICDKLNLPRQVVPHHNKTNKKDYSEYYDDETREIVAQKYAKDIEQFSYKFESFK